MPRSRTQCKGYGGQLLFVQSSTTPVSSSKDRDLGEKPSHHTTPAADNKLVAALLYFKVHKAVKMLHVLLALTPVVQKHGLHLLGHLEPAVKYNGSIVLESVTVVLSQLSQVDAQQHNKEEDQHARQLGGCL